MDKLIAMATTFGQELTTADEELKQVKGELKVLQDIMLNNMTELISKNELHKECEKLTEENEKLKIMVDGEVLEVKKNEIDILKEENKKLKEEIKDHEAEIFGVSAGQILLNTKLKKENEKLKKDFERIGDKLEFEGDTTCEDILDCLDGLFFGEEMLKKNNEELKKEIEELMIDIKAGQHRDCRGNTSFLLYEENKKLKEENKELKKEYYTEYNGETYEPWELKEENEKLKKEIKELQQEIASNPWTKLDLPNGKHTWQRISN